MKFLLCRDVSLCPSLPYIYYINLILRKCYYITTNKCKKNLNHWSLKRFPVKETCLKFTVSFAYWQNLLEKTIYRVPENYSLCYNKKQTSH